MESVTPGAGTSAVAQPAGVESIEPLANRPTAFTMSIQGGMLEALGINMYTTLGKCLVEFVANAYDAESSGVDIDIPVESVNAASKKVRDEARAASAAEGDKTSRRGQVLLLALPEDIKVTIRDTGNGMNPDQVQTVFLPVNRKRRLGAAGVEDNLKTENGRRYVMGRKGLGKLAGFGAAEVVRIETKRAGQNFSTSFTMRYAELANTPDLQKAELPALYQPTDDLDSHYTKIELCGLKCDAVKNSVETIRKTIAEAFFGIMPEEFAIRLNGELVLAEKPNYEFSFPTGDDLDGDGFKSALIQIDDMTEPLPYKYCVKFREKGAHLPAAKRGARIYCNNRLAAGPTLLDLPTGMHNFHAQSYMECIVIADELDRFGVDIINTNRTHLRQDSELVEKFLSTITLSMVAAIQAHSKFRDQKADKDIAENSKANQLSRIAQQLPQRTRAPIRKLLNTMAARYGVESPEFEQIAPLVIGAANASEVLIKLVEAGAHPQSIENVAGHLRELAEIEKSDALKLYRGRRSGIAALHKLEMDGEEQWKKKGFENQLHELFKTDPWLIRPEFTRPIVSDENLAKLASKLAQLLQVDKFVAPQKDGHEDHTRPDLVFTMCDSNSPSVITIVELKSPSLPLTYDHWFQLTEYMRKVEDFLEVELRYRNWSVHGILIGAMPDANSTSAGAQRLLKDISKRGPGAQWEVFGIRQLIEHARVIHQEAIDALEKDIAADGGDD
ncbi:ATP-binding protein [Xanthomonas campestris pv. campestris]|nr:ATP-binding protein [Xanthomonas campestris pv. campestris]